MKIFQRWSTWSKKEEVKKKNKNFVSSLRTNDNGNSVAVLFGEYEFEENILKPSWIQMARLRYKILFQSVFFFFFGEELKQPDKWDHFK